jgi:hypothetical protein
VLFLFLLVVGLLSIGVYVLFILNVVPGAAEERLGVLEPLPPDTGTWTADTESTEAQAAAAEGLKREVRHYFYATAGKLVLQVRYRNAETNEIVRIEPEVPVKRRRIRK